MIEGAPYVALRFSARIADDQPGRVPAAQLSIDNVGREIVKWIDRARATPSGIHGITVRVMIVTARGDAPVAAPDYDVRMDVLLIKASTRNVTIHLGFDPELGRPAVLMRHDPAASPTVCTHLFPHAELGSEPCRFVISVLSPVLLFQGGRDAKLEFAFW